MAYIFVADKIIFCKIDLLEYNKLFYTGRIVELKVEWKNRRLNQNNGIFSFSYFLCQFYC